MLELSLELVVRPWPVFANDREPDTKAAENWTKHAAIIRYLAKVLAVHSSDEGVFIQQLSNRDSCLYSLLGAEPFRMARAADYLVMLANDTIPRTQPLPIDRL